MRYDDLIDKHYHVYISERKAIVKSRLIRFVENIFEGTLNLNLDVQTSSTSQKRKIVDRSRKISVVNMTKIEEATSISMSKSINLFIVVSNLINNLYEEKKLSNAKSTSNVNSTRKLKDDNIEEKNKCIEEDFREEDHYEDFIKQSDSDYHSFDDEMNFNIIFTRASSRFKAITKFASSSMLVVKIFLRVEILKRKREDNDNFDHKNKIHRAYLTMFDEYEIENEIAMFVTNIASKRVKIFTSFTYKEAVEDSI